MSDLKKILIIDDEPDVIKYLTVVLKSNGFQPFSVSSVKEAKAEVEKISPDLICLDIMMPEETGISFYSTMKQDKRLNRIPVIIISGVVQTGEFDFQSYLSDNSIPPPEHFMEKPVDVEKLIAKMNKLINSSNSPKGEGA